MSFKPHEPAIRAALRQLPVAPIVRGRPARQFNICVKNSPRSVARGIRALARELASISVCTYVHLEHPAGCDSVSFGPVRIISMYDIQRGRMRHRVDVGVTV